MMDRKQFFYLNLLILKRLFMILMQCYIFEKKDGLFYKCHNCSASTNFGSFIEKEIKNDLSNNKTVFLEKNLYTYSEIYLLLN